MAAEKSSDRKVWVAVAGSVFTVFVVNYCDRLWTGYPHVYCGLSWALTPLFAPYWHLLLPVLTVLFLVVLVVRGLAAGLGVAALMLLAGGMPDFLKTLGELGVACH